MKWKKRWHEEVKAWVWSIPGVMIVNQLAGIYRIRIAYNDHRIEYLEKPTLQSAKQAAERLLREEKMRG